MCVDKNDKKKIKHMEIFLRGMYRGHCGKWAGRLNCSTFGFWNEYIPFFFGHLIVTLYQIFFIMNFTFTKIAVDMIDFPFHEPTRIYLNKTWEI